MPAFSSLADAVDVRPAASELLGRGVLGPPWYQALVARFDAHLASVRGLSPNTLVTYRWAWS
ncbi:MAG: hypothetical protein ACREPI_02970, partial [Candidatus Dormibacterales bacterium]